jgi:hypothetical protein
MLRPPHHYITPLLLILGAVSAFPVRAEAPNVSTLTTRHYRVHSDLEPALARELGDHLDAMYDEYARRLSEFNPPKGSPALEAYLFARRSSYTAFTGNSIQNSGGIFMPGRHCLAAFYQEQGGDGLRRTLQHEAFHQFAHAAISPDLPVWLNEGLAQLFEEGLFTEQGFSLGQVPPHRLRQLEADLNARRVMDFKSLMALTPKQWQARMVDPLRGAAQYNQAWAMVHFLVTGTAPNGDPLRPRLIKLLRLVHSGRDAESAWAEAFSPNIAGFQARFLDYCRSMKPTPEAAMVERVSVLADLLTELRSRGRSFDDMGSFRDAVVKGRYKLQYTRGDLQWSTGEDPGVYFADLDGSPLPGHQLYLSPRAGKELPDIVCQYSPTLRIRATFSTATASDQHVQREVLLEPTATSVQISRD